MVGNVAKAVGDITSNVASGGLASGAKGLFDGAKDLFSKDSIENLFK